jgi:hypothetical protein
MAIAYTELPLADGSTLFGVGINKNIVVAFMLRWTPSHVTR